VKTSTPAAPQPGAIDCALPPDVAAGGLGQLFIYQQYPAFTWPWFKRRAWVVSPFALAYGSFMGVWHASSMTTWADAFPLGIRAAAGALVAVSAGPFLATLIRYRRLPQRIEVALVILAVAVGLLLADVAGNWVSSYHDMLMQRHSGKSMNMTAQVEDISRILGQLMGELPRWLWLFIIGGGWELLSYVSERRRLVEYQRRQDLNALRRDKADADLRLAVLQAQIEPHFLFNTLASVRSLVRVEPERAIATINALSEYLRSTLPRLRKDVGVESATLGEQANICLRYLELMNVRMGGRITVNADIPDELLPMAFPPLLLISLVENAVKHGVEPKAGPASIVLRARLTGAPPNHTLQVDIEDDGVGLSEGAGSGVGLANVREQLQHRFGKDASLAVETLAAGGVRARIEVPATPA
jgi:hypothetical protein